MKFTVLFYVGLAIALILVVVYALKQFSSVKLPSLNPLDWFMGPSKPLEVPPMLQDFINQPSNQPGGYTPWTPKLQDPTDESWPPKWLRKN